MKYLKSYKTKEEYVDAIRGGSKTHSLPNVALINDGSKKTYYDIVRMSDNKSKDIWDRIKEKGWNYNTTSAITTQELALITSDEFNSLNETEWQNRSKVWNGLKTFDEFKYFTGVDNINAANKDSSGNRIGGFDGAKDLESITLPSSLKEIGDFAFNMYTVSGNAANYDTNLKHVYGGENVEKIGDYAFQCCSALTEFKFSDKLTEIGKNAFIRCYSLSHVSGGENVERIGNAAFQLCSSLTEFNFSDKLIEIGAKAFNKCYSLSHVSGGENIERIGKTAFQLCSSLTEFNFSDKLTEIGDFAFNECHSLSHVSGGENIEKIGECAFQRCSALTEFNFSDKLTEICHGAFSFCYSLQKAILPDTITEIHSKAFAEDCNLTNIGNLHNVKYIGDFAFDGWSDGVPLNRLGAVIGMLNYDGSFDGQMPNLEEVGIDSFQFQEYLKDLNMPKLRSIGPGCFYDCTRLKKITTSNCVRICDGLPSELRNVNGIEYDKAPNNCIIKDNVMMPISSITEWTFNDDETKIPSFFLYEATNLSSVTIPSSATSVGRYVFYKCSNLEAINGNNSFIGSGTTDIAYLFDGCKKLTELDLSNCDFSRIINYGESSWTNEGRNWNVTNSGLDYFAADCSNLTTLKLGKFNISGFTNTTNYNLFTNDTALKDIYITNDSPSLSFLESQCVLSKIASNVTIHFGEELYTYNGSSWIKS